MFAYHEKKPNVLYHRIWAITAFLLNNLLYCLQGTGVVNWVVGNSHHLRGTSLRGTSLRGPSLRGTSLLGSSLCGTSLCIYILEMFVNGNFWYYQYGNYAFTGTSMMAGTSTLPEIQLASHCHWSQGPLPPGPVPTWPLCRTSRGPVPVLL